MPGIGIAVTMYTIVGHILCILSTILIVFTETKLLKRDRIERCDIKIFTLQVLLCLAVIFTEAALHSRKDLENFRYFDAVYFTFITISTIGFGDFNLDIDKYIVKPHLFFAGSLLFFLGLGTIASIITSLLKVISSKKHTSCSCKSLCCWKTKGSKNIKQAKMTDNEQREVYTNQANFYTCFDEI